MSQPARLPRRRFVAVGALSATAAIVPRHVLGGPEHVPPSEQLTLAHIGMGTQGFREIGSLLADPRIRITAVCDPNTDSQDYIEWGAGGIRRTIAELMGVPDWRKDVPGCPGGREVGRQLVDAYYARTRGKNYSGCRAYADFRELLEKETDLDAVKIMTPDHLHAPIAVAAMRKGVHVMTHKPIANRLNEGRIAIETARQTKRATLLLAYGAAPANAAICREINKGVIGTLREIHIWTNRPVWPQYTELPADTPPVPKGFDWQLWLGPAVDRPYHPHYTHTVFRGWYDFGGGSMADMGIYALWPVFDELKLGVPHKIQGWGSHACTIRGNTSSVIRNDFSYPLACTFRFWFAAADGDRQLWWYDGGMRPRLPELVERAGTPTGREGIMFIGDGGVITAGFHGDNPVLHTEEETGSLWKLTGGEGRDSARLDHVERMEGFLAACRGELAPEKAPGNFQSAAHITDTVNLGTVALRTETTIEFDAASGTVTPARAAKYFTREYRPGWELT
ncbi:Gfo/Idh/MocA family oxidoreductase [Thermostilla marina]